MPPRMTCKQPECGFTCETLPEMRAHYLAEHPDAKGRSESAERQRRARAEARGAAPDAPKPDTAPPVPPATSSTPRAGTLERRLLDFFGLAALLPSMLGDQYCSTHLLNSAPTLAQVWARAAAEHKWLQEALEKLLSASTLTAALGTTAMTIYPILVHHGMAPPVALMPTAQQPERHEAVDEREVARGRGLVG